MVRCCQCDVKYILHSQSEVVIRENAVRCSMNFYIYLIVLSTRSLEPLTVLQALRTGRGVERASVLYIYTHANKFHQDLDTQRTQLEVQYSCKSGLLYFLSIVFLVAKQSFMLHCSLIPPHSISFFFLPHEHIKEIH